MPEMCFTCGITLSDDPCEVYKKLNSVVKVDEEDGGVSLFCSHACVELDMHPFNHDPVKQVMQLAEYLHTHRLKVDSYGVRIGPGDPVTSTVIRLLGRLLRDR